MSEHMYRQALRHAAHFAWSHKTLWIFGLFAGVFGPIGIMDLIMIIKGSALSSLVGSSLLNFVGAFNWLFFSSGREIAPEVWVWLLWLVVIVLGYLAFLVFTGVVSQGVIVSSAAQSTYRRQVDFHGIWCTSVKYFWKLFYIQLVRKILIGGLGVAVGWAGWNVIISPSMLDVAIFFVMFIIAAAAVIILSFLTTYTISYLVVEHYQLLDACMSAWKMFTSHWLVSIEMGAILLLSQFAVVLSTMAAAIFFVFPTVFVWQVANYFLSTPLFVAGFLFGIISFLTAGLLVWALYNMFNLAAWTYLFMNMRERSVGSRILGWLRRS